MMNQMNQVRHAEQQEGEDDYSRDDGGGRRSRSVLEWLRLFFLVQLLRVWKTCKKSEQLLPVTCAAPRTNPPAAAAASSSALHYTLEQSMSDTLRALSKAKHTVFTALLAILCGLLSLSLGSSNTTPATTRLLIRSCNFATAIGSICILASIALPFTLPRLSCLLAKLLFFVATGLLSICILLCFLLVHLSY